jgi:hypothetical protein
VVFLPVMHLGTPVWLVESSYQSSLRMAKVLDDYKLMRSPEQGHPTGLFPNSWPTENEWSSIFFSCFTMLNVREIAYIAIGNLQIIDGRPIC